MYSLRGRANSSSTSSVSSPVRPKDAAYFVVWSVAAYWRDSHSSKVAIGSDVLNTLECMRHLLCTQKVVGYRLVDYSVVHSRCGSGTAMRGCSLHRVPCYSLQEASDAVSLPAARSRTQRCMWLTVRMREIRLKVRLERGFQRL